METSTTMPDLLAGTAAGLRETRSTVENTAKPKFVVDGLDFYYGTHHALKGIRCEPTWMLSERKLLSNLPCHN